MARGITRLGTPDMIRGKAGDTPSGAGHGPVHPFPARGVEPLSKTGTASAEQERARDRHRMAETCRATSGDRARGARA